MTEKEVIELAEEIEGNTTVSVADEMEWIDEQIPALEKEEKRLISAFRLQRAVRNDERMNLVRTDLKKIRDVLDYLRSRKQELQ